jgi:hypothetical protein
MLLYSHQASYKKKIPYFKDKKIKSQILLNYYLISKVSIAKMNYTITEIHMNPRADIFFFLPVWTQWKDCAKMLATTSSQTTHNVLPIHHLAQTFAPSNFHLFRLLNKHIKRKLRCTGRCKLCHPHLLTVGIKQAVYHWDKCLNCYGNYMEKQKVCSLQFHYCCFGC